MQRNYSSILFERYADDIIVHCRSEKQARWIKVMIEKRLVQFGLELHPEKTKIVDMRYGKEGFDFLGFHHRQVMSHRYKKRYTLKWHKNRQKTLGK